MFGYSEIHILYLRLQYLVVFSKLLITSPTVVKPKSFRLPLKEREREKREKREERERERRRKRERRERRNLMKYI